MSPCVVALLDEWAERFFEELDYVKEGQNQTLFAASIVEDLPQIVVPTTFPEYTRRKVRRCRLTLSSPR